MKKKYWFLLSGILIVPIVAFIDTIIFQERNLISYIGICFFEWLIFFVGVTVGEIWGEENILKEQKIIEQRIKQK